MKSKNYKEVRVRLSLKQFDRINKQSELIGLTPAQYCRMIVITNLKEK